MHVADPKGMIGSDGSSHLVVLMVPALSCIVI